VLPQVNAGVIENADVSNQRRSLSSVPPVRFASVPFQVGRCVGLNRPTLFCPCVMISGSPLWKVTMPLNCVRPASVVEVAPPR
jgi:hypothetical protein